MVFSERLQTLRKEKRLSQEQLAELLNVSRQAVSKWESGQTYPEIDKLIKLSDLFNITIDDLIKDKTSECIATINDDSQKEETQKDEEPLENLMTGAFLIGIVIGMITGNYIWGTVGCFLAVGSSYIVKGMKKIKDTK